MTYTLIFSPEAELDILTALEYTEKRWSAEQADCYNAHINSGLQLIRENPYIGRARTDISVKHRSFPIEQHVAVYFIEGDTVYLSRLFHHSKDIKQLCTSI